MAPSEDVRTATDLEGFTDRCQRSVSHRGAPWTIGDGCHARRRCRCPKTNSMALVPNLRLVLLVVCRDRCEIQVLTSPECVSSVERDFFQGCAFESARRDVLCERLCVRARECLNHHSSVRQSPMVRDVRQQNVQCAIVVMAVLAPTKRRGTWRTATRLVRVLRRWWRSARPLGKAIRFEFVGVCRAAMAARQARQRRRPKPGPRWPAQRAWRPTAGLGWWPRLQH